MSRPALSIVVIGFDMARELPRTVTSLLPPYQRGVAPDEVEIIVVDNGSTQPLRRELFPAEADVRVLRVDEGGVSPCRAINQGVALARAEHVALMIDGARMVSPGMIRAALDAAALHSRAFVATLGFHLGPKVQQVSVEEGYTREVEDRLLADIGWPQGDGYRLFEICALGESYAMGVLVPPTETTFFVMRKAMFQAIGGYDERFVQLGGGLASFDFFRRAVEAAGDGFIMLVGEGTFHQLHYGATTQAGGVRREVDPGVSLGDLYGREYESIVGQPYRRVDHMPLLVGRITHPSVPRLFFATAG
ncbi:glycosyltransferase family 2 protein [Brevundimonas sp.]|uniref:glycosyltransferase family 2 protein n=1 Tax=Brevundimonas sp. TaxID=1871086 RepID=UPI0035B08D73